VNQLHHPLEDLCWGVDDRLSRDSGHWACPADGRTASTCWILTKYQNQTSLVDLFFILVKKLLTRPDCFIRRIVWNFG
ncbi:uncharacterized protein METZ01_LOCUS288344, partial [marine metagenome]